MTDGWQPKQYARFRVEREEPFHDLLKLLQPVKGGQVVDLGCGTGSLTKVLHEKLEASETVGIDQSEAMLSQSHAGGGVRFEKANITAFSAKGLDVVFSNAALQWLPDHETLFWRLAGMLGDGGQLAVQMPANHNHPSHTIAHTLARTPKYAEPLGGYVRENPVQEVEWYTKLLAQIGFEEQNVSQRVYLHNLTGPLEVVEWVKGSLLTDYRNRLGQEDYEKFLADYQERILTELPDEHPYLYAFNRILLWGRLTTTRKITG
ncbi:MAG: trans-aconitate methyltransferase [Dehalococcoidia bacterium]|nr:trans-aconitate methyltransferase [Dehalococcoidia bacterium]HCU99881.1 trans-aconitate methyltransferase [Dehalococcoidia bacterium]